MWGMLRDAWNAMSGVDSACFALASLALLSTTLSVASFAVGARWRRSLATCAALVSVVSLLAAGPLYALKIAHDEDAIGNAAPRDQDRLTGMSRQYALPRLAVGIGSGLITVPAAGVAWAVARRTMPR